MARFSVDQNHAKLKSLFQQLGWSVLDLAKAPEPGCPDLLVGGRHPKLGRINVFVEIKTPTGRVMDHQELWHSLWRGRRVEIARTEDDVLRITGNLSPQSENEVNSCIPS